MSMMSRVPVLGVFVRAHDVSPESDDGGGGGECTRHLFMEEMYAL